MRNIIFIFLIFIILMPLNVLANDETDKAYSLRSKLSKESYPDDYKELIKMKESLDGEIALLQEDINLLELDRKQKPESVGEIEKRIDRLTNEINQEKVDLEKYDNFDNLTKEQSVSYVKLIKSIPQKKYEIENYNKDKEWIKQYDQEIKQKS